MSPSVQSRRSCRRPTWHGVVALAVAVLAVAAGVAAGPAADSAPEEAVDSDLERFLLREGAQVRDHIGVVQARGARYVFVSGSDERRFTLLENLALQRMLQASEDWLDTPTWKVDGLVTEFREENYLLIKTSMLAE